MSELEMKKRKGRNIALNIRCKYINVAAEIEQQKTR